MRLSAKVLAIVIFCAPVAYGAASGAISGTVKDPSGAPFKGAFVRAQNAATKISEYALSDKQGRYQLQNLPPGEYEVRAASVGFQSDPRTAVKVSVGGSASLDFALQKKVIRWRDLSGYQGKVLMPDGEGKKILARDCYACHMFQSRMAAVTRDEEGWTTAVNFMRETMHARLANHISDQDGATLISYLNSTFGADSKVPKSPADLSGYKATVRPFSEEAMAITYVEYEMPGPTRMPFSAAPDKNGKVWIPDFGRANRIGLLDPETGAIQEFMVPNQGTAGIHSVVGAPDGSAWIAEQASNKLGRWDPKTKTVTEYQDTYKPGMEGLEDGGSKHTVRVDLTGRVWASAVNSSLTMFDPKTNEFSHFPDTHSPYGLSLDPQGNIWFAEFTDGGEIGMVDAKTNKVSKWAPPTPNGWPRRIEVDKDGIVWFAEFRGGKIGRFDPKTKEFKEYALPGPSPTPYAFALDKNHDVWYSSDEMDIIGRLDPRTGHVTEYPYPHAENMMKEFFLDSQGRIWYGSPPNNTVGYFIPPAIN